MSHKLLGKESKKSFLTSTIGGAVVTLMNLFQGFITTPQTAIWSFITGFFVVMISLFIVYIVD